MLITTRSSNKPASNENDGNRSISSKNDDNKLVYEKNDGINEVNGFGIDKNGVEYVKK